MAQLIFSSLPSNRSNLVTWHKVKTGTGVLSGNRLPDFCFDDTFTRSEFTRPYPKVEMMYENPLVVGEEITFFTNFQNPGEIPIGTDIRVYRNREGGEELTSQFTVQTVALEGRNLYVSLLPKSGLTEYTRVVLVMFSSGQVTHISRGFVVVPDFRNVFRLTVEPQPSIYFHYPYLDPGVMADFTQSLLVRGNLTEVSYPEESEIYREVTTGRPREEVKMIERRLGVETYMMDLLAHEAIAAAFFHKGVRVNDLYVSKSGEYDTGTVKDRDLSNGSLELIDLSYGHRIKACP